MPLLVLAAFGCPSNDVPIGDASSGHGSESSGVEATSALSATGTLPPTTSSGSDDVVDSTASTTLAGSSGTTQGDDIAASDDVDGCQCCGNGIIDGTEQCDCGAMPCTPEGLDFAECVGTTNPVYPERVYTGGIIDCSPASCQLVFTNCSFCGDGSINGNETCEPDPPPQDTCASLGLGDAAEPLPCDESCQLDTSSCR